MYEHAVVTILNEVITMVGPDVRTLSIQFDGASENWNKIVLGYANLLVECGRFDEIQLCRKF